MKNIFGIFLKKIWKTLEKFVENFLEVLKKIHEQYVQFLKKDVQLGKKMKDYLVIFIKKFKFFQDNR